MKSRQTRVGNVTITAPAPAKAMVQHSVKVSTQRWIRLRYAWPECVRLRVQKDVPLYSHDSDNPDVMIRKLNGAVERGNFVDGVFKAMS